MYLLNICLATNVFMHEFAGYGMGAGDHRVGRLMTKVGHGPTK